MKFDVSLRSYQQQNNKSLMQGKGASDDVDNYSDEEEQAVRKIKIRPMNLTREELKARLQTLKDYGTWKKTKVKRILIRELIGEQKSPAINAALSCGNSNGVNQVLLGYIKLSQHFQQTKQHKLNPFQKLLSQHSIRSDRPQKSHPSFISYKTKLGQKHNIHKMTSGSQQQIKASHSNKKQGSKNSQNLLKVHSHKRFYPQQLQKLKSKLRGLPSIIKRVKTEHVESNPEEQGQTEGLTSNIQDSKLLQQSTKALINLHKQNVFEHSQHQRQGRQAYIKGIQSILSKSELLLDDQTKREEDKLRGSSQSITDSTSLHEQKGQARQLKHRNYWPQYSKYAITGHDRAKLQNLLKQFKMNHERCQMKEESLVMANVMQKQFWLQQKEMDRQLLEEEKNSVQHRFKQKINLERENYRRNVKELLRCKKEYRIQKQREEIRANGIKRNRKLDDVKPPKKTIESNSKQQDS